jgi:hypothetical protein
LLYRQYICAILSSKHFTARANFPAVKEGNHGGLPLQNGESDPELFALLYIEVFAACANFLVVRGYPKQGFARAKTPRTTSPEVVISTEGRNLS